MKEDKLTNQFLKLISVGEEIMIGASDGQATIAPDKKTFKSISLNFKYLRLDRPGVATTETSLDVYELVKNATFIQMFDSLNPDYDKLVMTQAQIIQFCEKYLTFKLKRPFSCLSGLVLKIWGWISRKSLAHWLRQKGYTYFFLIKKDAKKPATFENLFVVNVYVSSDDLFVFVYYVELGYFWGAKDNHCLVTTKSLPSVS